MKLSEKSQSKYVDVIGFPMDLGADRRGVDMGPSALRIAGIEEKFHPCTGQLQGGGGAGQAAVNHKSLAKPRGGISHTQSSTFLVYFGKFGYKTLQEWFKHIEPDEEKHYT